MQVWTAELFFFLSRGSIVIHLLASQVARRRWCGITLTLATMGLWKRQGARMLVSHRHRFIYTKTGKTAGTSVESYFERFCMEHGRWTESHYRDESVSPAGIVGFRGRDIPEGCLWWNHMSAELIRDRIGAGIWESYFKFCVVRNPYEKVLSNFYFLREINAFSAYPAESDAAQFERWLTTSEVPLDRDKYLVDGRLCMDFVVKYESLHADLEHVCSRLSLPWRPELLPKFKAGMRPATGAVATMYTPTSAEVVRSIYDFEFDCFGYSRDLVS